ncbi:hypothetical protein CRC_01783 [Cylindrospermopsis raciborskii CS-505]|nr:hypothetical protein CRC_01783 [Cylindrospermopsis raciborskii CS-505]
MNRELMSKMYVMSRLPTTRQQLAGARFPSLSNFIFLLG